MRNVSHADRLAAILQRYLPTSKECAACAREVQRLLQSEGIAAEVVRVTHALLGQDFYTQDGVCFAETGFHVTMRVNGLEVQDAPRT